MHLLPAGLRTTASGLQPRLGAVEGAPGHAQVQHRGGLALTGQRGVEGVLLVLQRLAALVLFGGSHLGQVPVRAKTNKGRAGFTASKRPTAGGQRSLLALQEALGQLLAAG